MPTTLTCRLTCTTAWSEQSTLAQGHCSTLPLALWFSTFWRATASDSSFWQASSSPIGTTMSWLLARMLVLSSEYPVSVSLLSPVQEDSQLLPESSLGEEPDSRPAWLHVEVGYSGEHSVLPDWLVRGSSRGEVLCRERLLHQEQGQVLHSGDAGRAATTAQHQAEILWLISDKVCLLLFLEMVHQNGSVSVSRRRRMSKWIWCLIVLIVYFS